MSKRDKGISKRYSVVTNILSAVIISLVFLTLAIIFAVQILVSKSLTSYNKNQLNLNKTIVQSELNKRSKELLNSLESLKSFFTFADQESIEKIIKAQRVTKNGLTVSLANTMLIAPNGNVYGDSGFTRVDSTFIDIVKANGKGITIEKNNGTIYLIAGITTYSQTGKTGASLFKREVINSFDFINTLKNTMNCDITIFDGYTRSVTTIQGMAGSEIADKSIIDSVMAGQIYRELSHINGQEYVTIYFPLNNISGKPVATAFVGSKTDEINKTKREILVYAAVTALVIAAIIILLIVLQLRTIVIIPLRKVSKAIGNLASGQADLTYRIPVSGKSEFSKISNDTNVFIENLQAIMKEVNETQASLGNVVSSLAESSETSAAATSQIHGNIENVRSSSEGQKAKVLNASNVISGAVADVQSLGSLIVEQTADINESSASIEQMIGNIRSVSSSTRIMAESFETLTSSVRTGRQKLDDVNNQVKGMLAISAMLQDANSIIANISSQTNLLAMNAAIEAAHAGQAGKGFSVVADEIRKLAENSTTQSNSIKMELQNITSSIDKVVKSSADAGSEFSKIVEHIGATENIITSIDNAMLEQQEGSKQILIALGDIKDQSEKIRTMSANLEEGFETITQTMEDVTNLSSTIYNNIDEVNSGSQMLNQSANSVSGMATTTQANVKELKSLIDRFTI